MKRYVLMVCAFIFVTYLNAQRIDGKCGEWRLARNVLPTHYDITIRIPTAAENNTFTGSTKINLNAHQKTDTIVLHSHKLIINASMITVRRITGDSKTIRVIESNTDEERDLLRLKLEQQISKDSSYILDIPEYTGVVHAWLQGFFVFAYTDDSFDRMGYSTFFEPAHAREVFPCFDEPDMKATFTVRVERPDKFKSYSNMPLNNTIQVSSGWNLDTFEESPFISTYTLGITVYDYEIYPQNGSSRTRILLPKTDLGDVKKIFKFADDALLEMEKFTNITYPLSKLDHVGLPYYAYDGMEHLGLIIYPRRVFKNYVSKAAEDNQMGVKTIIHEVAHQWFGNLITMDWWSNFWLNEAFPAYLEYCITDKLLPEWRIHDQFLINAIQKALAYDSTRGAYDEPWPLSSKAICDVKKSFQQLIHVSYEKGASVLRMFQGILGSEERFQRALRNLLINGMKKSNIKPNDVFAALDEVNQQFEKSHLPPGLFFNDVGTTWIEQAGVPLVTVIRNYTSGTVTFKQERFYSQNDKMMSTARWWIPLTWSTADTPNCSPLDGPQDWFYDDKTISLNISASDWLLVNVNVTGYYRVEYDVENWSLLARALVNSPQRFSASNRAQILNDAVAVASADPSKIDIAFDVAKFLADENDRVVWLSASNSLYTLLHNCIFARENSDRDNSRKKYLRRLVRRAYDMVSISLQPAGHKETHLDGLMRGALEQLAYTLHVKSYFEDIYLRSAPDWLKDEV